LLTRVHSCVTPPDKLYFVPDLESKLPEGQLQQHSLAIRSTPFVRHLVFPRCRLVAAAGKSAVAEFGLGKRISHCTQSTMATVGQVNLSVLSQILVTTLSNDNATRKQVEKQLHDVCLALCDDIAAFRNNIHCRHEEFKASCQRSLR